MNSKPRFHFSLGLRVADELLALLRPACDRIEVAGSLRRRKPDIGDVELVCVPRIGPGLAPGEMIPSIQDLLHLAVGVLAAKGILKPRLNVNGANAGMGSQNKLMVHVESGMPVDIFSTKEANFWNTMVVRTGPADLNKRIAAAAQRLGIKWNVYGEGFSGGGRVIPVHDEAEVFRVVGIPFKMPWER